MNFLKIYRMKNKSLKKRKRQIFIQNNFEILFNKEAMACKVAEVFDTNNIEDMTWKMIHDIEWDWYKTEDIHGVHHSVLKPLELL